MQSHAPLRTPLQPPLQPPQAEASVCSQRRSGGCRSLLAEAGEGTASMAGSKRLVSRLQL